MDYLGLTDHCDALVKYNGQGRMNSGLISCIELMKEEASGGGARLVIREVEVGEHFTIEGNLDGFEWIRYRADVHWLVADTYPKAEKLEGRRVRLA